MYVTFLGPRAFCFQSPMEPYCFTRARIVFGPEKKEHCYPKTLSGTLITICPYTYTHILVYSQMDGGKKTLKLFSPHARI